MHAHRFNHQPFQPNQNRFSIYCLQTNYKMPGESTSRLEVKETPNIWKKEDSGITLLKDSFKLRTLMLFGALIQSVFCLTLPTLVATLPTVILAIYTLTSSIIQYTKPRQDSPYMQGVITGNTTAQLPNRETGLFSTNPAADPVVVFHFGVRFNHPLGIFSPGGQELSEHFFRSLAQVQERAEQYGLLGLTRWQSGDRDSQNTMLYVCYFRDVEGLRRFASGKAHRDAVTWANREGPKHIGFFHETFCVPRNAYESSYRHMPPTLLGQARVPCATEGEGEKEGQRWISTLVDADKSFGRMQFSQLMKRDEKVEGEEAEQK